MSPQAPLIDSWLADYEWPDSDPAEYLDHAIDPSNTQPSIAKPAVVDVEDTPTVSSSLPSQAPVGVRLPLLRLAEWDESKTYDEHQPTCMYYSLEWKLILNGKVISKDNEQNLVLAPSDFWERTLRKKLDKLLKKKLPSNESYTTDDTNIVVSAFARAGT